MKDNRASDYLSHMLDAARLITSYIEGMSKEDFLADTRTQQAVIFNIIVIGEAATSMLKDHTGLLNQFSNIPWTSMQGMRNRIAHGYFEININTVWETASIGMPELQKQLQPVLEAVKEVGSG
jgi:uncharacterized protein with HEPN domain